MPSPRSRSGEPSIPTEVVAGNMGRTPHNKALQLTVRGHAVPGRDTVWHEPNGACSGRAAPLPAAERQVRWAATRPFGGSRDIRTKH